MSPYEPDHSLPLAGDTLHRLTVASALASNERVLKYGDTFGVFDRHGDLGLECAELEGIFHDGTRFLSQFTLSIGGGRPLLLGSSVRENNVLLTISLANPTLYDDGEPVVPHGTINVVRKRLIWDASFYERMEVTNFGYETIEFELALSFSADFVDVFEVRGHPRSRRGQVLPPELGEREVVLRYRGLDDVVRRTRFGFDPAPQQVAGGHVVYRLRLAPKERTTLEYSLCCEQSDEKTHVLDYASSHRRALDEIRSIKNTAADTGSSHEYFHRWLQRSRDDLVMMLSRTDHGMYPYAGVPWYNTPFGRDGLLTALEALWVKPDIGAGVLRFLAANQADGLDDAADAEPGKIVHEMRLGEMAALREIPFGRYYGSVDSTPLFLLLAGRYWMATGDLETCRTLWPSLLRAVEWIDRYGDLDGDGFVEYGRRSATGLVHQGWKDSTDSVFHADGPDAEGPIALCEVQGYVYAAKRAMADLATALGHDEHARRWEEQAEELRERFDRAFWCDDIGSYALALDGEKKPCRVRTSNAGHCLYTGIAHPERAAVLAETLMSPDMFSGFGIRTVSTREVRYNPISYHNGSVWPHDNAIIARGLSRYGYKRQALEVMMGLFDASREIELQRLPELFCGFPRLEGEGPTLYPVACSPQAWAAAAPFMLLEAALGMTVQGAFGRVLFERPVLPPEIGRLGLRRLHVGDSLVDIDVIHHPTDVGINVTRRTGELDVVVVK